MADSGSQVYRKKKNKRSLLYKARKYGKKGRFGRGQEVDEDTYQYFVRVLERLRDDFETPSERDVFVTNVLSQTKDKELFLCCNQLVSRVIEKLLPFSNDECLRQVITALGSDLRLACVDAFASHVVEEAIIVAASRAKEDKDEWSLWVMKMGRFVLNNMEEFAWHTYANHIARTLMLILADVPLPSKEQSEQQLKSKVKVEPIAMFSCEEWEELVKEFGSRMVRWPQIAELVESALTAALIQSLLVSLHKVDGDLCQSLATTIAQQCFTQNKNIGPIPFSLNPPSLHTLESLLSAADEDLYNQLYENCFKNHLLELIEHSTANFTVQKLLDTCKSKEMFESIFSEVGDKLEDVLSSGNTGVVHKLCQGCLRLQTKQAAFVQCIMKAFHCWEPVDRQLSICPLLLHMITYDVLESGELSNFPIHLHGSLIVQDLLRFSKPIKFVNSLLNMESSTLRSLAEDPRGSHVFDAFTNGHFVGEKSRDKLILKMEGNWVPLSCSKHGSRVVDCVWKSSNLKQRSTLAKELSAKESLLEASPLGKFISTNCGLWLFRQRNEEWKQVQTSNSNKQKMLKDVFGSFLDDVTIKASTHKKLSADNSNKNRKNKLYISGDESSNKNENKLYISEDSSISKSKRKLSISEDNSSKKSKKKKRKHDNIVSNIETT